MLLTENSHFNTNYSRLFIGFPYEFIMQIIVKYYTFNPLCAIIE